MELNYSPLINKALTLFQVRENLTISPEAPEFIHPFITIAREPGSGGAPIAQALAQKLQYELVDDVIIEEIARKTKRRSAIIKEIDEKSRSKIEDLVHSLLNMEYVDEASYIQELVRVLLSHAHKGHCVILGRGANFITPFGKGLHVSITAPYDIRVKRAMDYEGHNLEKAKQVIAQVEKDRRDFVTQYFRADTKRRNSFDLTINTAYFTVPQVVDIIVEAFKQKFHI